MFLSPVRVAHMYFELEMTQQQIASELGVSRMRISRMLQQARTDGTVTISIRYGGFFPELEDAIAAKFPGVRAIVADGMEGSVPAIGEVLAVTAADYLTGELQGGARVAVGWGSTVRRIADRLTGSEPGAVFVPMIGGQGHAALDLHSTQISFALARAVGGQSRPLLAPAVVRSVEERAAIVANPEVHEVLAEAASADLALFSVGAPFAPTSTLESAGYFSADDLALLRAEDARCDVVSLAYLDSRGEPSAASLSERSVAITQAQLRNIPQRVCVAGGADKAEAIALALAAGFVTVLITDDATARALTA